MDKCTVETLYDVCDAPSGVWRCIYYAVRTLAIGLITLGIHCVLDYIGISNVGLWNVFRLNDCVS